MQASGYSGRPLEQKLGIKSGFNCLIYKSFLEYEQWFSNLNIDLKIYNLNTDTQQDFIHCFCITNQDLEEVILKLKPLLKSDGMIWISWPKKASNIPSELNRDIIRDFVLQNGLVDVKVASINENWSGLKFVYRLKDRN